MEILSFQQQSSLSFTSYDQHHGEVSTDNSGPGFGAEWTIYTYCYRRAVSQRVFFGLIDGRISGTNRRERQTVLGFAIGWR